MSRSTIVFRFLILEREKSVVLQILLLSDLYSGQPMTSVKAQDTQSIHRSFLLTINSQESPTTDICQLRTRIHFYLNLTKEPNRTCSIGSLYLLQTTIVSYSFYTYKEKKIINHITFHNSNSFHSISILTRID
ncbi:hypothetical protein H4Q26_014961 [Puccinia striiformis f. sp. tritici PST-130]|uniref:Uncharacterized protein n=1 Tax=Puccinia striiformis f. sp. tritici PST-78 TaxID=1165861 RepID=A0A0L0VS83_9BASI|nr:hypothetical protein H4Q26_014961 [Puccinia striiformis f. sp. tritici PST-130]KNF02062.1 hypothetical protein PSTG_04880 [Puccinia striiformis f. sp. tritici PST-78]